jgi:ribonucleoside-diphosphate reductase beta chain
MSMSPPVAGERRTGFSSLSKGGLDWDSLPLRLYLKGNAKFWNPADLDFSRDAEDWQALPEVSREALTGFCAMFVAGEEAVTHDLQPFMSAMAAEGRTPDEMFLTQFCFEEAKHTEAFRRWLDAVGVTDDLHPYVDDNKSYRKIFYEALPEALDRLREDPSPANQVRASITYNHVVEGTLALTGYYAWQRMCTALDILPGMRQMVIHISADERRHMAWGTFTCRRHVADDERNWTIASRRMRELLPHAVRQVQWATRRYPDSMFGVTMKELLVFAREHAMRRLSAIEAARRETVTVLDSDLLPEQLEADFAAENAAMLAPGPTAQR